MQTIKLSSDQQAKVKNAYDDLQRAQDDYDREWWRVSKILIEVANELGLPNLDNTEWGGFSHDYSELICKE